MNIQKKVGLIALCALVAFTTAYAFKSENNTNKKVRRSQTWTFTGTELSQATDTSYYELNPSTPPDGCGEGEDLPCEVPIEDNSVDTREELQEYIMNEFNNDPEEVLEHASSKRAEP